MTLATARQPVRRAEPTRTASTAVPLHPLLAERWSPRGLNPQVRLTGDQLLALLEAARWSPSASNRQPWRFLVAERASAAFDALLATLAGGNQVWAGSASALILAAAVTEDDEGNANPWAAFDTGQAVAHLTVQAQAEGLVVHQMGGFDPAAARKAFELPEALTPIVVAAVGVADAAAALPGQLAERERAPRVRLPLAELLLGSRAGTDLPLSA